MSNWPLYFASGVGFNGFLPSAFVDSVDEFLTKVPNWMDGSDHTASGQVKLRGAGLRVYDNFQADDATITITSGKSLAAVSGSTFVVGGTFTVGTSAVMVVNTQGTFTQANSNTPAIVATGNGTAEGATITGGPTGRGATLQAGGGNTVGARCIGAGIGVGVSGTGGAAGAGGEFVAGGGNTAGVLCLGTGSGAGASLTGGTTGVGVIATPGTASTAPVPQCAGQFAGFIEITAVDPAAVVVPPAGKHVIYGLSVCKAYCSVDVVTGGPIVKNDEHNIFSVTEIALGNYQVTFLQVMASADYTVTLSTNFAGRGASWNSKTASGFRFTVYDTAPVAATGAATTVDFQVFGRR